MNLVLRLFAPLAAYDPKLLARCPPGERAYRMCQGMLVLIAWLLASGSMGYLVWLAMPGFGLKRFAAPALGVAWGLLILNLSRMLVQSQGARPGPGRPPKGHGLGVLALLVYGLTMGGVVGIPLDLALFTESVRAQPSSSRELSIVRHDRAIEAISRGTLADLYQQRRDAEDDTGSSARDRVAALSDRIEEAREQVLSDEIQYAIATRRLDGLQPRLTAILAVEPVLSVSVMLLCCLLFLAPVIDRLLRARTPYDYLQERAQHFWLVRQGIAPYARLSDVPEHPGYEPRYYAAEALAERVRQDHVRQMLDVDARILAESFTDGEQYATRLEQCGRFAEARALRAAESHRREIFARDAKSG